MDAQTIELATADGPMPAYEAVPDTEPDHEPDAARGAVVVLQEAFGVNDHIEDVTRRFADAGYHAVAPHLFHRAGGGTAPYDDFAKVMPLFEGMSDAGILVDVDAALDHLRDAGFTDDRIAFVGFCLGGRASFLVALERALGAGVGFYGGGIVSARVGSFPALVDRAATIRTPWLGLFGDADQGIPLDDVEQLRTALSESPLDTDVVRYAHAEHGFHCDVRASYHPEASADAWARTLAWFDAHLA